MRNQEVRHDPELSRKQTVFSSTLDKISLVTSEEELETLTRNLYISFIAYYINILYMSKFTML